MQLFDYQSELIENIRKALLEKHKKLLITLPTGGGKTVIFCELVRLSTQKQGGFVTVLVHRQELAEQTVNTLQALGVNACLLSAKGAGVPTGYQCYVGMIETIYRRVQRGRESYKRLLDSANFVIVDEAHFTNFVKVLDLIPKDKVTCQFTATPLYATKKHKITDYHSRLIVGAQPQDLIDRNRLVPPQYFIHQVDETGWQIKNGEFSDDSIIKSYEKQSILQSVVQNYFKWQKGEKTVCFCSSISYALAVTEHLKSWGINAKVIDSKHTSPEERVKIFEWIRSTPDAFLVNVGIATTGTDIPDLQSIILLRATTSLTLYIQMVGRGARVAPDKTHFKVFDYGNNRERHGYWEQPRDWEALIKAAEKPKRKKKPADDLGLDVVTIPAPDTKDGKKGVVILQPDGSPMPQLEYLLTKKWGEMTEAELLIMQKLKGYKHGWLIRQIYNNYGVAGLENFAQLKGYSNGWVYHQQKKLA